MKSGIVSRYEMMVGGRMKAIQDYLTPCQVESFYRLRWYDNNQPEMLNEMDSVCPEDGGCLALRKTYYAQLIAKVAFGTAINVCGAGSGTGGDGEGAWEPPVDGGDDAVIEAGNQVIGDQGQEQSQGYVQGSVNQGSGNSQGSVVNVCQGCENSQGR